MVENIMGRNTKKWGKEKSKVRRKLKRKKGKKY